MMWSAMGVPRLVGTFLFAMVCVIAVAEPAASEGLTLKMLIVNDYERVQAYGGDLDALHAASKAVFEEAARKFKPLAPALTWVIADQVDFATGDPYSPITVGPDPIVGYTGNPSVGTDYESLSTVFNKWLTDNATSLPAFDVAHLFSMRNFKQWVEGWALEDVQNPFTGEGGKPAGTVCRAGYHGALSMVYKKRDGGWSGKELDLSSTTVAHETAHQFGALHDGANGCSSTSSDGQTTFMSPTYVTPTTWSSCSYDDIKRTLPTFKCLGTPLDSASPRAHPTLFAFAVTCMFALVVNA